MNSDNNRDQKETTSSGLQQSQEAGSVGQQSGAELTRDQQQSGQGRGGQQMGGGAEGSDTGTGGGGSGSGGYGSAQNQENHQGKQNQGLPGYGNNPGQSRGERFDEQQGGGRSSGSVSDLQQSASSELDQDQRAHQDRGQSEIDDQD